MARMAERDSKPKTGASDPRKTREAKLAQALRANLRRRKAAGAEPQPQPQPQKTESSENDQG